MAIIWFRYEDEWGNRSIDFRETTGSENWSENEWDRFWEMLDDEYFDGSRCDHGVRSTEPPPPSWFLEQIEGHEASIKYHEWRRALLERYYWDNDLFNQPVDTKS